MWESPAQRMTTRSRDDDAIAAGRQSGGWIAGDREARQTEPDLEHKSRAHDPDRGGAEQPAHPADDPTHHQKVGTPARTVRILALERPPEPFTREPSGSIPRPRSSPRSATCFPQTLAEAI